MIMLPYIFYIILLNFLWPAESSIALITKSKGSVEYKQKVSKQFLKDIYVSKPLNDEDLIKTGRNGFAKFVYIDDGSAIFQNSLYTSSLIRLIFSILFIDILFYFCIHYQIALNKFEDLS